MTIDSLIRILTYCVGTIIIITALALPMIIGLVVTPYGFIIYVVSPLWILLGLMLIQMSRLANF